VDSADGRRESCVSRDEVAEAGAGSASVRDWFDLPVRVRYAETDAQGVVHHANYLVYMEQARTEFTRSRGLPYRELEARGVNLLVSTASIRFRGAAVFDDVLTVRLRISLVRSRTISFEYRIVHADTGRLLITGETTHVFVDARMRPMTAPSFVLEALLGLSTGEP
jgi:acyl-CoA thioester hydrolase